MSDGRASIPGLLGDTVLYGLPRIAFMALSVLLVPLYTRYFAVAEYGVIENLNVLGVLLTSVFSLALPQAILRFYSLADSERERVHVLSSATLATAALGLLALAATWTLADWLGRMLLQQEPSRNRQLILLLTVWVASNLQLGVFQSALLARFRRREYLTSTLGSVLLSVLVTVVCLVGLGLGLYSVFLGPVVGYGAFVLYTLRAVRPELRASAFRLATLQELLAYSVPFVPAALAMLAIRSADRYFITLLLPEPLHQVGLYSTAEKVMGPLTLLGAAFSVAWSPFAIAASRQENARALYVSAFKHYVALTSLGVVVLCAAAPFLLRVLTTPPYYPSFVYTPPLGLYLALNSLYYVGSIGLVLKNRTGIVVPMVLAAALVNAVLNLAWIPRYGVSGAAWATVVAFLVYNSMVYIAAERLYPVGFPLGTALAVYALATAGAYLALRGPLLGGAIVAVHLGVLIGAGFLDLRVLRARCQAAIAAARERGRERLH